MKDYSDVTVILDELKARHNITSDYKLSKLLEISRTRVSNYRCGTNTIDDDVAQKIDKLLDLPEGVIALEMHARRTKCPNISKTFHEIAQKLAAGALCLMIVFSGVLPRQAQASGQNCLINNNLPPYTLCTHKVMRRRRRKWINCFIHTGDLLFSKNTLKCQLN